MNLELDEQEFEVNQVVDAMNVQVAEEIHDDQQYYPR